jgi:hypothetical protein
MLKNSYIFSYQEGHSYMKLDHFNNIRKGSRSIDVSDVTKSLTVQTAAKLKLVLKRTFRLRKHTDYPTMLLIRPMPTETTYFVQ